MTEDRQEENAVYILYVVSIKGDSVVHHGNGKPGEEDNQRSHSVLVQDKQHTQPSQS